jgi:hypothetical protein
MQLTLKITLAFLFGAIAFTIAAEALPTFLK